MHSKNLEDDNTNDELEVSKKVHISPEKRQRIIDKLRLVKQYDHGISKNSKFVRQHNKSTI